MKKKLIALTTVIAIATLVSCNSGSKTTTSDNTTTEVTTTKKTIDKLYIGTTQVIEKATYGEYSFDMLASGVSELPLVYQDSLGNYKDLVCTWKTEDSLTWTYTVKDGMKWSDGVDVTAEDILFTLEYEDSKGSANLHDQTVNDKTTKKKYTSYSLSSDKRSISLTLASANVRELSNMTSFRIAPKHVLENVENPTEDQLRVSCGPYKLESFNESSNILKFVRNEYYPEQANVDTIYYQLFSNEDVLYTSLSKGEIDMAWGYSKGVDASYYDILKSSKNIKILAVEAQNAPAVLAFNNAKGLFADENLRLAVSYALDYEKFLATFGSEYASVSERGFVPKSTFGYKETEKNTKDLTKALEYLAKAGYTKKNSDGFYENSNGVLGFSLTVNSAKALHIRYAELVKTELESFGIRVTLDSLDSTAYNAKTSNKFSNNNITMEAAIYGYTAAGMGMLDGLGTIYVNGNHAVQGGGQVFAEEFQNALSALSNSKTPEEYKKNANDIVDYYATHSPLISLYWDSTIYAYSSKLSGISADAVFGINNAMNWFTIEKN